MGACCLILQHYHCPHDTRLSCSLHRELALSLPCRRTQEAMNLWQVLGQKAATPSTVLPPGVPEELQEAMRQSMSLKAAEAARELRSLSMRQAGQQQGPGQQVGLICSENPVCAQGRLSPVQLPVCCDVRVSNWLCRQCGLHVLTREHQLRCE